MPKIPETLTLDKILEAIEADAYLGFCLACGAQHDGIEPDARGYECEDCEERSWHVSARWHKALICDACAEGEPEPEENA